MKNIFACRHKVFQIEIRSPSAGDDERAHLDVDLLDRMSLLLLVQILDAQPEQVLQRLEGLLDLLLLLGGRGEVLPAQRVLPPPPPFAPPPPPSLGPSQLLLQFFIDLI